MQRQTTPIKRLPHGEDGETRYLHPHGYVIERGRRIHSERTGRIHGQADPPSPLIWWTIFKHVASYGVDVPKRYREWARHSYSVTEYDTLAAAREWCDLHPRDGWTPTSAASDETQAGGSDA